jgi:hypothetical protein
MTISRTVQIEAPAQRVWDLVSDLPKMGELSPENRGGRWISPATGPAVGAAFKGANRAGRRRWSTKVVVTRCESGKEFFFTVTSGGLKVAEWGYTIEPDGLSCSVTESWQDQRGGFMTVLGCVATGVGDRTGYTQTSIDQTLAALKKAAEATG